MTTRLYLLLGIIKEDKSTLGYLFYNLDGNQVVKVENKSTKLNSFMATNKVVGCSVTDGKFICNECSIERFPTFTKEIISKDLLTKVYIISYTKKSKGKVFKVLQNKVVREYKEDLLIGLIEQGRLSLINAKVVNKNNTKYISAIKGTFAYMDMEEKTTSKPTNPVKPIKSIQPTKPDNNKVGGGVKLYQLTYSLLVCSRWLERLNNYEDLGRMFINKELLLSVSDRINTQGLEDCLNKEKDRKDSIQVLEKYVYQLKTMIAKTNLKELISTNKSRIQLFLNTDTVKQYLDKKFRGGTNTSVLVDKATSNLRLTDTHSLYFLTMVGVLLDTELTDSDKFIVLYSFGKSLDDNNNPVDYENRENRIGSILAQGVLLDLYDSL